MQHAAHMLLCCIWYRYNILAIEQNLLEGLAEDSDHTCPMASVIFAIFYLFLCFFHVMVSEKQSAMVFEHLSSFSIYLLKFCYFCLQFTSGHVLRRGMKGTRSEFASSNMRCLCKHIQTYPNWQICL